MAGLRAKRPPWATPVAVLAVLGVVILVIVALWLSKPEVDEETLCPINREYARTVILIDATNSLSESQAKGVRETIGALREDLDLYEWVGVFVLTDNNLVLAEPEVAKCNPGSEPNPLYENPEEVIRIFEYQFWKPIDDAIKRLLDTTKPSETSPILEMIREVALDKNFIMTQDRRLIVVSDLLQHVPPAYSHYRDGVEFDSWRDTAHGRESLQVSLLGVKVEILYLKRERNRNLQTRGHIEFWEKYFDAVGATVRAVKPIS